MSRKKFKYFAVSKPYGVLSQFTDKEGRKTLNDLYKFPKGVYPVGRLDMDSEGLLLLTDDSRLTDLLLNPVNQHEREYHVQVEGIPSPEALELLRKGVFIHGYKTLPCKVKLIEDPGYPPRIPPVRERKNIPTSWISIALHEGKNRQVRKMTAAAGYPTLRLIRVRIKDIKPGKLKPGGVRELSDEEINSLRK